jgi:plastocyanin
MVSMGRLMSRLALIAFVGLFGSAASAQAPGGTAEQAISVQLSDFKFSPGEISLQAGRTYRLHFENASSHGHSFSSQPFFEAASVRAEDQAKVEHGTIEVGGGQSVDVRVTPLRAGQYRFHCSHFMHSTFGMTGAIIVQ